MSNFAKAGEYVTFNLAGEEYGIDITQVLEFIGNRQLTTLPNVPHFVKGLLNLRGAVVPVIDLRSKFGLTEKPYDKFTVFVIVEVRGRTIGMIVDSVSDVINLDEEDIRPRPTFTSKIRADFIKGMAQKEDKFVVLMDTEKVLSIEELEELELAA